MRVDIPATSSRHILRDQSELYAYSQEGVTDVQIQNFRYEPVQAFQPELQLDI